MIRFENVVKRYGGAEALGGVSLEVAQGELCVLLGPSGCGKTTLLRLVNRLIEPSEGRILVGERDVMSLDPVELRRGMGYVIQSIGLFPHMTVLENVVLVPKLLGWAKERREERAREMLALVGLEPETFLHRYPRELSGGQAQRVGLARALAADPPVLLMDEPFGAVDPPTRARLQDEFLRLQAALKKTILFVTHDLEEAVRLADRICLMNQGQIEQVDPPERLLTHPQTPFVERFLGESRALLVLERRHLSELLKPLQSAPSRDGLPVLSLSATARDALSQMIAAGSDLALVQNEAGELVGEVWMSTVLALSKGARFSGDGRGEASFGRPRGGAA
jgi:osmoprotectant transport system ATP-binding protein